jgi:hypothetical protein
MFGLVEVYVHSSDETLIYFNPFAEALASESWA